MPGYTLLDLRAKVYARIDNNTLFYTQTEVDSAINEAIKIVNVHTGFQQGTATLTDNTQPRRHIYNVPESILFPLAVHYEGRQLGKSSISSMALHCRDWLKKNTVNYGPVSHWGPIGIDKFFIFPADYVGGHLLQVSGVLEPSELLTATSTVTIEDEFIGLIEDMAVYTLVLKEGGKIFQDAAATYMNFLHELKELSRWQHAKNPRFYIEREAVKIAGE